MFKSEAKLFLSANNNINSAKTLINECKRLIIDFDLEGNSDCKNLKSNINNCNINELVTKVEDTKESLMKLDQDFASEYMTLLREFLQTSTIDTSNMTEEEKMQYSIQMDAYTRDYNQNLLYMLEKYEESGMLTAEMKQQLQYQKELVAQYDIQDKMAVLDSTTDEYINLFKQYADYDRKLINLNPSLTQTEKDSYLKEYNTQYNQNLDALTNARNARLKREKDERELEELYTLKEDNNGFWHPFVESEIDEAILDKRIAMEIASEDEIAYKNMNGWDRFWTNTGTFAASTFTGLFNITEGIGDAFVMLGSAVKIVDKEWASDFISRDISGELYQGIQLSNGMNSYSAYGTYHTAGEAFGGFVGKAGITFAAPWASAALYGLDAMGQSAETSFNNGDEYWTAFGKSVVSGIGGASEGYGLAKLNLGIRDFVSSGALKIVGGTAWSGIKNLGTTLTSPEGLKVVSGNLWNLAKSGVKNIPSALGKAGLATLKDVDALIETGCVLANNFIEGVTTGEMDLGKLFKEAGAVVAINYFMSLVTTLAFDIDAKKANLDTPATVADDVSDVEIAKESYRHSNDEITDKIIETNKKNYQRNASRFTSEKDYYDAQAYVAKNNYWYKDSNDNWQHKVLDKNDPGLASCYTKKFKKEWNNAIDSYTVNGITKTNNYNTNVDGFIENVLGPRGKPYGTFGYKGNYNFGSPGSIDESLKRIVKQDGENFINTMAINRGTDVSNAKRIIFTEVDVPRESISMHTGKELGSNIQRLPGALPDNSLELVYETIDITDTVAKSTKVVIKNENGKTLFNGSLSKLKAIQNDKKSKKIFNSIMGIIDE